MGILAGSLGDALSVLSQEERALQEVPEGFPETGTQSFELKYYFYVYKISRFCKKGNQDLLEKVRFWLKFA